jgi:hypothetical protein
LAFVFTDSADIMSHTYDELVADFEEEFGNNITLQMRTRTPAHEREPMHFLD